MVVVMVRVVVMVMVVSVAAQAASTCLLSQANRPGSIYYIENSGKNKGQLEVLEVMVVVM